MTNWEKYKDELINARKDGKLNRFVHEHKEEICGVSKGLCDEGMISQYLSIWLAEEYQEPEVDWSKVTVDTPILVRDHEDTEWLKKYFAKYENGIVFTWAGGSTSWSNKEYCSPVKWKYAKLAE